MENLMISANAVLPMCLVMALGYGTRRLGWLRREEISTINKIAFRIFLPCLLYYNIYCSDLSGSFDPLLMTYAVGGVLLTFGLALGYTLLTEKLPERRGVLIQGMFRSNYVIMGIPVATALLGATNALTEDKIAAINKANTEVALAAVVSSPDCEFPPIEEIPQAAIDAAKTQSGKLTEAYRVVVNGEDAGYAFKIVAGGSQGDIEMIVGVDADLAITGISVVDAAETSGIGTKVIANEATTAGTGALDQFVGKSGAGSLVVKTNIDAVSGATVTTKGITKGANAALAAAEAMA